jgi:DNA-binding response OmpR family regulator
MRKKILIVDDDRDLLDVLRLSLKASGFSIATATDGIEALRKARTLQPDLILLDLVLPELDGFAVCETVRKDRALSATPVIALTGLTSELTRLAGLDAGATEYVTKPVSPRQLIPRIKQLLRSGWEGKSPPRPRAKPPLAAASSAPSRPQ